MAASHLFTTGMLILSCLGQAAEDAPDSTVAAERQLLRGIETVLTATASQVESSVVAIARVHGPAFETRWSDLDPFGRPARRQLADLDPQRFVPTEFGTGVLIASPDGNGLPLVLTAFHVATGTTRAVGSATSHPGEIVVRFAGGAVCHAYVHAADPRSDLAVLRLDAEELGANAAGLKPIVIGNADDYGPGRFVLLFGNPYALARDGSAGIGWGLIGNTGRRPGIEEVADEDGTVFRSLHYFGTLWHVDARLPIGTSGAAVTDLEGRLIGIGLSLAPLEGFDTSAGFVIPLNSGMRRIVDELSRGHEAQYGFLGIHTDDISVPNTRLGKDQSGKTRAALAKRVFPGSPAAAGGVAPGDAILAVNGREVHGHVDLVREVGQLGPETIAELTIYRDDVRRQLTRRVNLGKWPVHDDEAVIATVPRFAPWRGVHVEYPTGRRKYLQDRYYQAVVVDRVEQDSPASAAGLNVGDFITHVNGVAVATPAEFHAAVASAGSRAMELQIIGGDPVTVSP